MIIIKIIKKIILILNVSFAASTIMAATPDPMNMLQQVSDNMLAALKQERPHLKQNPDLIYDLVNKYLLPHVDLTGMSRSVLGREVWAKATEIEKQNFTQEFTHIVINTYSSALNAYTDEKMRFYPIRGGYEGKQRILVDSHVLRDQGQPIAVSYRMVLLNNQWKVYDLNVEGIGLLESFRSQFGDLLSKGRSLGEITQTLKSRNQNKTKNNKSQNKA